MRSPLGSAERAACRGRSGGKFWTGCPMKATSIGRSALARSHLCMAAAAWALLTGWTGASAGSPEPSSALATVSVFATGLNNPRGLKFGPDHHLYVAEGGVGGQNSTVGQCEQVPQVGP